MATVARRLLVDADALGRVVAAATSPDPNQLRAALAALVAAGIGTPSRPWLTVTEAARTYGVSERTVRREVARGRLEHRRVGRRLLIAATSLAPNGPERTPADTPPDTGRDVPDDGTTSEEPHP
jgi:excisionase family DNA binding protein